MKTMFQNIYKGFAMLALVIAVFASAGVTQAFAASPSPSACVPAAGQAIDIKCADSGDVGTINQSIYKFASIIAGIVLGLGVLMIVYAGFKYATSQGDPKTTEQAKMQIIAAGVGIGIAMFAFVILNIFKGLF
jgi:hypothetical protein